MIKVKSESSVDATRLHECEKIIERGFAVFFEVGQALAEIRDAKLYRGTHKTFEAYCRDRWEIGRSRAYELIDQAKIASAVADAGVDLSAVADISKRDAAAVKDDLPAIAANIKAKVDAGADPKKAVAETVAAKRTEKEQAKAEKAAQQAENDRRRDEFNSKLPSFVKDRETAKAEWRAKSSAAQSVEALQAEIEELQEANAALEAEVATLKADNAKWEAMRVQFEQGGFEKVIAGKDAVISGLETRLYGESADKASWMKSAKTWQARALELGWTNDEVIDLEAGEVVGG